MELISANPALNIPVDAYNVLIPAPLAWQNDKSHVDNFCVEIVSNVPIYEYKLPVIIEPALICADDTVFTLRLSPTLLLNASEDTIPELINAFCIRSELTFPEEITAFFANNDDA
jgi:hypothetical protein